MMDKNEVLKVVLDTVEAFVDQNGIEVEGAITPDKRLIGKSGIFDSMDLVNFLVDLEEQLEEQFDRGFSLSDERAMSRSHSPFMNAEELTKFIFELDGGQ